MTPCSYECKDLAYHCSFPAAEGEEFCFWHSKKAEGDFLKSFSSHFKEGDPQRVLCEQVKDKKVVGFELTGGDFQNGQFPKFEFLHTNLSRARFVRVFLREARFIHVEAFQGVFDQSNFNRSIFQDSDFRESSFRDAFLNDCELNRCDIAGADFSYLQMINAKLMQVEGSQIKMDETNITQSQLIDCDWDGISMRILQALNTLFQRTRFANAIIDDANMMGVCFKESSVKKSCFQDVNMRHAVLEKSKFNQCRFRGVDWSHAKIDESTQFEDCQFENCTNAPLVRVS